MSIILCVELNVSMPLPIPPLPESCSVKILENIDEGSTVLLHFCDFTTPVELTNLTLRWKKDGEEIDIMADQRMKYEITHEGYLSINNVQESDSGSYYVEIQNEWGSAVRLFQLIVTPNQTGRLFVLMFYLLYL